MSGKTPRGRRLRAAFRSLPLAVGALLVTAGAAIAVGIGLQNPSFESGLDNWTAKTYDGNRDVAYAPGTVPGCDAADGYNICVVEGPDTFEVTDGDGTRDVSVSPVDGDKMLRLAGPFHDDSENQAENHSFAVQQDFVVDPANPVLELNYNLFTFDYSGFDELRVLVNVTDEDGQRVAERIQGGFSSGTDLKTTGWRGVSIDLTEFASEQMHLSLELQGTSDDLYGSWGYFDAGQVEAPPVDPQGADAEVPNGVDVKKYVTDDGLVEFQFENSDVDDFATMPLTLDLPINAGTATLSNVILRFRDQTVNMSNVGGNVWRNDTPLQVQEFQGGDLTLEYDATESDPDICAPVPAPCTQHFIVTVGSIVLIDPQGIVHDINQYNQAISAGQTPDQARATAAIVGATVRLQRETPGGSGTFANVLSADPGISPNVNPQITGADGKYQWDVSAGRYRVVVVKTGYDPVTSQAVDIPPPVLDLHIPMTPVGGGGGSGGAGNGGGGAQPQQPLISKKCKKGQKLKKGKCVKAKRKKKGKK